MVGSAEAAEDILQDACERFLRHAGTDKRLPHAWLRKVVWNLALNHIRRRRRSAEVELPEAAPELETASTVVESEAERLRFKERCSEALSALSDEQVKLIRLRYWRGMTVEAIATELDTSAGAIHMRLARALNRLRAAMCLDDTYAQGRS